MWAEYTSTEDFITRFRKITENTNISNDERALAVETFILEEAVTAKVVKEIILTSPKNPNKWGKTMAPWFDETCREKKVNMGKAFREYGKGDARSVAAHRDYLRTCHTARKTFAASTPDLLKYQPKRFWGMLNKHKNEVCNITAANFADFNQKLYFNDQLEHDEYCAVQEPEKAAITVQEVQTVLMQHFKANKSTGLSLMPLQCLKWLGDNALPVLTTFLNDSALF